MDKQKPSQLEIANVTIKHLKNRLEVLEKCRAEDLEQLFKMNEQLKKESLIALRDSEERFRALFEGTTSCILFIEDRIMKYINQATLGTFGYTKEEMIGKDTSLIHVSPESYKESGKIVCGALQEKGAWHGEWPFKKKDGEIVWMDGNISTVPKGGIVAILHNISDQKRADEDKKKLEAQLWQAQKMEAIGTLAGGVAHDFNNLLMGIQGRSSLMLLDTDSSHPHFEHLKSIEDYVESAAELTSQLLGFARGEKYEVKPTTINELIKKQNRMFGRTKKEITIRGKYEKNLWSVMADQGQIEQVILNLYINAWQAMPAGGDLYIQTQNVIFDEKHTKPYQLEPGNYVKISITDTGMGMDEATQQRIFEPFFTTKEMGRGTGLGLATVYGIIKNHEGFIDVYSEKGEARPACSDLAGPRLSPSQADDGGQGMTFNIYLPAAEAKVPSEIGSALHGASIEQRAKSEDKDKIVNGTETVLLVDDENVIIYAVEQLLKEMGYKTLIARSGKETVKIYKKNKDKIDMVILDMVMPDMGGGDTYDRLKEINTDIRVLLSSGYSIDGQATEILERGCNGFIQKPYRRKELSQKIREILGKD